MSTMKVFLGLSLYRKLGGKGATLEEIKANKQGS
jgi:hypothetical protein